MATHQDSIPSHYPCVTQKDDIRRVHHPHAEHVVPPRKRVRRALARLRAALRAG